MLINKSLENSCFQEFSSKHGKTSFYKASLILTFTIPTLYTLYTYFKYSPIPNSPHHVF